MLSKDLNRRPRQSVDTSQKPLAGKGSCDRAISIIALVTTASLLVLSVSAAAAEVEAEFVDLFAAGDFSEWRVSRQGRGWIIEEGVVRLAEIRSGSLMSRRKYRNFELRFEWKVSEGGNSGVIYRAQKGRGLEYQVLDDQRHKRGREPIWSAAALYDLMQPKDG